MRTLLAMALGGAAVLAAGAAMAEPSLEIRRAAVRVIVMPENRTDISVEVRKSNPSLPLYVDKVGDSVVVDGRPAPWFTTCHGNGPNLRAMIFGKGDFAADDLPQIIVHTPMDVRIATGGIVVGSIGRAHSVDLHHGGCGGWTVANVEEGLQAALSGSGVIETGSAGTANLVISGSGRLKAGVIRNMMTARVSGSGAITSVSSGGADLTITGSGSVASGPVTGGLNAVITGSGDLTVARLEGPMTARISGVGHVRVPAGQVTAMDAKISGSGGIEFGGVAQSLDAVVSGVGSVRASEVTGSVSKRVSGAGSVQVGR